MLACILLILIFSRKKDTFYQILCRQKEFPMLSLDSNINQRDVAQLGSAPALGAGCRRFKSCHPDTLRRRLSISILLVAISFSESKLITSL